MAFPFVSETNFETGTLGSFDAEADTESRLDFPHYSELARFPHTHTAMPWRGAYCMRVKLENDGTPADAYVQETGSWDMTAGTNDLYVQFMVWISPDTVMANSDEFALLQFWSSTNTVEAGVYLNYTTANGYRIGIGEASASSFKAVTTGRWICVEVFFDPAGSSASTLDAWVDNSALTQVASFTSADITSGVVGVIGQDAGTTRGTILFDSVRADDARMYTPVERFPDSILLTKSGHAFIGPGSIDQVSLLSGAGTDCVMAIYDTDTGYTSAAGNLVSELKNTSNSERVIDLPLELQRGCYVSLSGTNPRALMKLGRVANYSEGIMRTYASKRRPNKFGA